MNKTENYGFNMPEADEFYDVELVNENTQAIDAKLKEIESVANPEALNAHVENKENPHGVTKSQVGLGNVPNVATNDQTPTYTVASANTALSSGEKLSAAFGKIAKAVNTLISHIADTAIHFTSAEKTKLSGIAEGANAYTHPSYTARTGVPAANQTPAFGGTFTVTQPTSDASGHVTGMTSRTITIPSTVSNGTGTAGLIKTTSTVTSNSGYTACPVISGVPYYKDTNTDTKNTAGSTDTSSKIFLIGATSQAANPQTYSHDTCYVGTDGCLYSNGTKVDVSGHSHAASKVTAGTLGGKVQANATAQATLNSAQVRDIYVSGSAVTEGGSSSLANGTIVFTKG